MCIYIHNNRHNYYIVTLLYEVVMRGDDCIYYEVLRIACMVGWRTVRTREMKPKEAVNIWPIDGRSDVGIPLYHSIYTDCKRHTYIGTRSRSAVAPHNNTLQQ